MASYVESKTENNSWLELEKNKCLNEIAYITWCVGSVMFIGAENEISSNSCPNLLCSHLH